MEGRQLYQYLIEKRDYSGNADDEYAQLLITLFCHIGQDLYLYLESAHKISKKLALKPEITNSEVLIDEYTTADIILV